MYGAKRIKIEKTGTIVLAGERSYHPIGKYQKVGSMIVGKILKPENIFERKMNETNSVDFKYINISQLRECVKTMYANELNKLNAEQL
jgi:hypothetical protein